MQKEILNDVKKITQEQTARVLKLPKEVNAQKEKINKLRTYDASSVQKRNWFIPELSSKPWGWKKRTRKSRPSITEGLAEGEYQTTELSISGPFLTQN
jgi:hypothetical protein